MENLKTFIDFLTELQGFKTIERYCPYPKKFRDTVAEHCMMMTFLADLLIDYYDIKNLDFRKVVRYINFHDMGELGMKHDIPAYCADEVQKEADEHAKVQKFLSKHNMTKYLPDFEAYNAKASAEARFVFALDKLEAQLFKLSKGSGNYPYHKNNLIYADKAAEGYPTLKPIAAAIKTETRAHIDKTPKEKLEKIIANFERELTRLGLKMKKI